AGARLVRAKVAVDGTGEDHAGDRRDRGGLRAGTTLRAGRAVQLRRRRAPKLLARGEFDGVQAAGLAVAAADEIGNSEVGLFEIGGGSPSDAAERASLPPARLPQDLAMLIGIESPDDAGLLPADEDAFAAGELAQNRRAAEIVIGSAIFGAVDAARAPHGE